MHKDLFNGFVFSHSLKRPVSKKGFLFFFKELVERIPIRLSKIHMTGCHRIAARMLPSNIALLNESVELLIDGGVPCSLLRARLTHLYLNVLNALPSCYNCCWHGCLPRFQIQPTTFPGLYILGCKGRLAKTPSRLEDQVNWSASRSVQPTHSWGHETRLWQWHKNIVNPSCAFHQGSNNKR